MDAIYDRALDATQRGLYAAADPSRCCSSASDRRQFSAIDNGIRHMRLDNHFLSNSQLWRQQQPSAELQQHQSRAVNAMRNSQAFIQDYMGAMSSEQVASLRENQLEANRDAAQRGLADLRQEVDPVAMESHDRVQRFCDWVGVTDRFTGYRNNLTRGSRQPLQLAPSWRRGETGRDLPPLAFSKFVPEALSTSPVQRFNIRAQSATAGASTARELPVAASGNFKEKTPQEAAGINTTFPGTTEHHDRYTRPQTARAKFDYAINPCPDFTILGRPLKAEVFDRPTEYQDRYLWPDSKNLQPTPWRKG